MNIIELIKKHDIEQLKKIVSPINVNLEFEDHVKVDHLHIWFSPLGRACSLLEERNKNLRYNGISSNKTILDDLEIVKFLVSQGADINHRNRYGETPLMIAINGARSSVLNDIYGTTSIGDAARIDTILIKFLIDNGADLNLKDNSGCTALHIAAMSGLDNIVDLLMSAGADIGIENNNGDLYVESPVEKISIVDPVDDSESLYTKVENMRSSLSDRISQLKRHAIEYASTGNLEDSMLSNVKAKTLSVVLSNIDDILKK